MTVLPGITMNSRDLLAPIEIKNELEDCSFGELYLIKVPSRYIDCVTLKPMRFPVLASDGYNYELETIVKLFARGHFKSPMINDEEELLETVVNFNFPLYNEIRTFFQTILEKDHTLCKETKYQAAFQEIQELTKAVYRSDIENFLAPEITVNGLSRLSPKIEEEKYSDHDQPEYTVTVITSERIGIPVNNVYAYAKNAYRVTSITVCLVSGLAQIILKDKIAAEGIGSYFSVGAAYGIGSAIGTMTGLFASCLVPPLNEVSFSKLDQSKIVLSALTGGIGSTCVIRFLDATVGMYISPILAGVTMTALKAAPSIYQCISRNYNRFSFWYSPLSTSNIQQALSSDDLAEPVLQPR